MRKNWPIWIFEKPLFNSLIEILAHPSFSVYCFSRRFPLASRLRPTNRHFPSVRFLPSRRNRFSHRLRHLLHFLLLASSSIRFSHVALCSHSTDRNLDFRSFVWFDRLAFHKSVFRMRLALRFRLVWFRVDRCMRLLAVCGRGFVRGRRFRADVADGLFGGVVFAGNGEAHADDFHRVLFAGV